MIVRTHHENCAGMGYPAGLRGDQQHIFTRIVRLCDAYETATAKRVYANAKSPARALWEMTAGDYRHYYDPVLTKMFGSLIQPFPIGAKLRLSDGRTAVIVRYNRKMPFHPHVIVAFDEKGRRLDRHELSEVFVLGEQNNLYMAAFGDESLDYLQRTPPPDPTPAPPAALPVAITPAQSPPPRSPFESLWDANYP